MDMFRKSKLCAIVFIFMFTREKKEKKTSYSVVKRQLMHAIIILTHVHSYAIETVEKYN